MEWIRVFQKGFDKGGGGVVVVVVLPDKYTERKVDGARKTVTLKWRWSEVKELKSFFSKGA